MEWNEILETIKMLSQSQGFYCRLLSRIEDLDKEDLETFKTELESKKFKDAVDLVLYFES